MSDELNNILIKAYNLYKKNPNPPVPLENIKEFLKLEGIELEDSEENDYDE